MLVAVPFLYLAFYVTAKEVTVGCLGGVDCETSTMFDFDGHDVAEASFHWL